MADERVAVVLAGGKGSRLKPFTAIIPKPLVPIGDESIVEVVLQQLAGHGFERVFMSIGHLGHLIEAVIGDGSRHGLEIEYVREPSPLGTVGPLHLMADRLPQRFLVLNGDVLTDLDFAAMLQNAEEADATLMVATYPRRVDVTLGVIDCDAEGRVTAFREKPRYDFQVSMGVYAMHRRVLAHIPAGEAFGFDQLMHAMLAADDPVHTFDWSRGRWLDIGRHADFATAQESFAAERSRYLPGEDDAAG